MKARMNRKVTNDNLTVEAEKSGDGVPLVRFTSEGEGEVAQYFCPSSCKKFAKFFKKLGKELAAEEIK